MRLRQPTNGAKDFLHGGRFANQTVGLDVRRGGGALVVQGCAGLAGVRQGAAHQGHGLVHVKRFGQVLKGAALVGLDGAVQVGMRRHDDHRHLRAGLAHLGQQAQAVHAGHPDVGQDGAGRGFGQLGQGGFGAVKDAGVQVGLGQCLVQHPADGLVVVNDPDKLRAGHGNLLAQCHRWWEERAPGL